MATTAITARKTGGSSAYITVLAGASISVFTEPTLGFRETVDLSRTGDDITDVTVGRICSEGEPSAIITGPGKFKLTLSPTKEDTVVYYDV